MGRWAFLSRVEGGREAERGGQRHRFGSIENNLKEDVQKHLTAYMF